MITFCSARSVKITANPDMPWTLDGERESGHHTVEVVNIRQAFKLLKGKEKL